MINFFLNLLFPIRCLGCRKKQEFICKDCLNKIPINNSHTKFKDSFLNGVIASSDYNNLLIKQAIFKYKYEFAKELAKPLGLLMANAMAQQFYPLTNIFLVPIPLHKKRLRWRGFNQAELLSKEISQQLNLPIADCLIRTKNTLPQMKINNAEKRRENIKNAFSLNTVPKAKIRIQDKTIILIDDVCSTGATLEQCAKELKSLRPKEIWGFVLASGN
ncbi:ComF family protein [Patescibacteria group bacterium]